MSVKLVILGLTFGLFGLASTDASAIASAVPGSEPLLLKYGSMGMLALVLGWVIRQDRLESARLRDNEAAERAKMWEQHRKEREEAHLRWSADIGKIDNTVTQCGMKLESLKEKISDTINTHKGH